MNNRGNFRFPTSGHSFPVPTSFCWRSHGSGGGRRSPKQMRQTSTHASPSEVRFPSQDISAGCVSAQSHTELTFGSLLYCRFSYHHMRKQSPSHRRSPLPSTWRHEKHPCCWIAHLSHLPPDIRTPALAEVWQNIRINNLLLSLAWFPASFRLEQLTQRQFCRQLYPPITPPQAPIRVTLFLVNSALL